MFIKKLFGCRNCDNKNKTIKKIAIFSSISAGLGAFLGLLFAPKKGSEFRKDIADKSKEIGSTIADKSKEASTVIAEKTKQIGESANHLRQNLIHKGQDKIVETADDVKDYVEDNK